MLLLQLLCLTQVRQPELPARDSEVILFCCLLFCNPDPNSQCWPLSQRETTAACSSRLCTLTTGRLQKPRTWQSLLTLSSAAERRHEGPVGRVSCGPSHPACLGVGVASPVTSLPEAWLFNRETRRGSCITWAEHSGLWVTRPLPLTRDATASDHYVTSSIHGSEGTWPPEIAKHSTLHHHPMGGQGHWPDSVWDH